jgi:hypothetical protein
MNLLNTVATVALAVFALFSVLIYWSQLKALKINERAWIVPGICTIKTTPDPQKFHITVDLQNTGKTPAWITAAGSNGQGATDEKPLPAVPSYVDMKPFPKKGNLLSPGGVLEQGLDLTKERLDHVLAGKSKLFVFGYARYRDIYEKPHIVRYCFEARKSQDANHPHPLEFYVSGPDTYSEAD